MRLIVVLLILAVLKADGGGFSQTVTYSARNVPLERVLDAVKQQTGYVFFYTVELMAGAKPVTIEAYQMKLETFLDALFRNQPFAYSIRNKAIILSRKVQTVMADPSAVRGRSATLMKGIVINAEGIPLEGASVRIRGTSQGTSTDAGGQFSINVDEGDVLIISFVGYITRELTIGARHLTSRLSVLLQHTESRLDQVQIIAYGTTTKRFSTGNTGTLKAADIEKQPVANPLLALSGRIAGVYVEQESGVPGTGARIQIRGRNSIGAGNNPLYIVDGVPFPGSSLSSLTFDIFASPFNSINPADIESIDVLKDADATAIYGSRAANGVVLITTRKGKEGKTRLDLNMYRGLGHITRAPKMLSARQYLRLRHDAFANDGLTPDGFSAPDLLEWDTTKYTDFNRYFLGNNSKVTDANAALSGGDAHTRFLFSGAYRHETGVYPGSLGYTRGGAHLNIEHNSPDKRFRATLSAGFTADENKATNMDITSSVYGLPPDFPLYEKNGKVNWQVVTNPMGILLQPYRSTTRTLVSNAVLRYTVLPDLNLKISAGYSQYGIIEVDKEPAISKDPSMSPTNDANFSNNQFNSYILEPQVEYNHTLATGKLNLLAGATWQQNVTDGTLIRAFDFGTEDLMESPAAAKRNTIVSTYINYRYQSVFARANYNLDNKYILNATFRRDGSTRFAPEKRYGDFWALGGAWLFSNERGVKVHFPWLDQGKLRGSYAVVGNDQISDYGYLSTYQPTFQVYSGTTGLSPTRISNPDYSWETSKKLEAALEMSFLKERVSVSIAWFRNRCGNQLVNFPLSPQSGFSTYQANLPALVQNTGWEFELSTTNIKNDRLTWTSAFNLTLPRNRLLAFPGIAGSAYARDHVIGESLNLLPVYHFLGIDPSTGEAKFEDKIKDGVLQFGMAANGIGDQVGISNDPSYYGGMQNSFSYGRWQLDVFVQFVRKRDFNMLAQTYDGPKGSMANQPVAVLTSPFWASTTPGMPAYDSYQNAISSDAMVSDASYVRLKNVSFSYTFPTSWIRGMKMLQCRLYLRGQNLLTFTHYLGYDPETSSYGLITLPPLRMLTAGIQCSF
ncbi:MAG: SusC/RagA family TonB-linked outer membrane protein [Chitinophagaceae bacterium]|nr:SusC/RagA family TonB-linked outer membrane protein [Chitinophagaceae bacterium]